MSYRNPPKSEKEVNGTLSEQRHIGLRQEPDISDRPVCCQQYSRPFTGCGRDRFEHHSNCPSYSYLRDILT